MENLSTAELLHRISNLEEKIQTGNLTSERMFSSLAEEHRELEKAVNELKSIVQSLDKEMAIRTEKQSHLFYQITQLEKTVSGLQVVDNREIDRKRDLVEKIFMAVLGATVTYIFSMLRQK